MMSILEVSLHNEMIHQWSMLQKAFYDVWANKIKWTHKTWKLFHAMNMFLAFKTSIMIDLQNTLGGKKSNAT